MTPGDCFGFALGLFVVALIHLNDAPQKPFVTFAGQAIGLAMVGALWAAWRWVARRYRVRVERRIAGREG